MPKRILKVLLDEPIAHQQKLYFSQQKVIDALSQEKACFANDKIGPTLVMKLFSNEVFKFLLEQLGNGTIVTKHLSFGANVLNEQQAIQLIELLETNETLQSLEIIIDNSPATTQAIAKLLKKNKYLKEIQIKCDNEGAIALAEALGVNDSLQKLVLSYSEINNEGAIALAEALGVNTNLQELDLSFNHDITKAVLPYFRRALEVNENLQIFKVCNYNIELDGNVIDYLRSSECKYNKPDDDSTTTTTETSPHAENVSPSTEEKQKDDDNQRLDPLDEQSADDNAFNLSTLEEALPPADNPDNNAPLELMGESSGQTEGDG